MKYIIIAIATLALASCGTSWNVKITPDGITATPDGPIIIQPQK